MARDYSNKHSVNTLKWRNRKVEAGGRVVTLMLEPVQVAALTALAHRGEKLAATLRRIVGEHERALAEIEYMSGTRSRS